MHVFQPFDLVFGLLMLSLGLVGLGRDLYQIFTGHFTNHYGDWRSLGLSVWFIFGGPVHCSKAFDAFHQQSHRTAVLETIESYALYIIITVSVVAWIARRRLSAEQQLTKAGHPAP